MDGYQLNENRRSLEGSLAAGFVDTFMELDEKYGPVTDIDGQQAAEQEQVRKPTTHTYYFCTSDLMRII